MRQAELTANGQFAALAVEAHLWDMTNNEVEGFPGIGRVRYAAFRAAERSTRSDPRDNGLPWLVTVRQCDESPEENLIQVWQDLENPAGTSPEWRETGDVDFAALSSDGRFLVYTATERSEASSQVNLVLCNLEDGTKARSEGEVRVTNASFSPGSRLLLAVQHRSDQEAGKVVVWNLDAVSEGTLPEPLHVVEGGGRNAFFGPTRSRVQPIITTMEDSALLWNLELTRDTLEKHYVERLAHKSSVFDASFSSDGRIVATSSRDRTVRIWDTMTGRPTLPSLYHDATVGNVAFHDQKHLVALTENSATVWELATLNPDELTFETAGTVRTAAISPDGKYAAAGYQTNGNQHAACVWSTQQPNLPRSLEIQQEVSHIAFDHQSCRLVTVTSTMVSSEQDRIRSRVQIWDARSGTMSMELPANEEEVTFAAFSADGQRLLTVAVKKELGGKTEDGLVRLWKMIPDESRVEFDSEFLAWRQPPGSNKELHRERVTWAALNADRTRVVTASVDDSAKVWKIRDGGVEQVASLEGDEGHTANVNCVAFDRRGRVLTASADRTAKVWDLEHPVTPVKSVLHDNMLNYACFSNDDRYIATAGADGSVKVWSIENEEKQLAFLPHRGEVWGAAFDTLEGPLALRTAGFNMPLSAGTARRRSVFLREWRLSTPQDLGAIREHSEHVGARTLKDGRLSPLSIKDKDKDKDLDATQLNVKGTTDK